MLYCSAPLQQLQISDYQRESYKNDSSVFYRYFVILLQIIRELSTLQSALDNDELEQLEDQLKKAVRIQLK